MIAIIKGTDVHTVTSVLLKPPSELLPASPAPLHKLPSVRESVNEVVFYLEEKNIVPEKYTDQDTESKGFYDPVLFKI